MSEFFIQEQQLGKVTRTIVKDQAGSSLFLLVGRWGTRGDALSLYAMNGEILASIKQVSWTFGTRFELYQRFEKVGTLRKLFNLNADFYYVQNFTGQLLGISKRTNIQFIKSIKIMSMDKTMLCTGDYFVLTVANDEDAPLCICIAAVLDYWLYNKKNKNFR